MRGSLLDQLARALDPAEREAVLGDLAESRPSGTQALRDVASLIVRRQAAVWKQPDAWLGLLAVFVVGAIFARAAHSMVGGVAVDLWMFAGNWETTFLRDPAFQDALRTSSLNAGLALLLLICLAWIAGLIVGACSARAALVNGCLLCLLLVSTPILFPTEIQAAHVAVFEHPFYRVAFPFLVEACLVIPAVCLGIAKSSRSTAQRLLQLAAIGTLIFQLSVHVPHLGYPNWLGY